MANGRLFSRRLSAAGTDCSINSSHDLGAWSGRYKVRPRTDRLQTPRSPASPTRRCREDNRSAALYPDRQPEPQPNHRPTAPIAVSMSHGARRSPPETNANRADSHLDRPPASRHGNLPPKPVIAPGKKPGSTSEAPHSVTVARVVRRRHRNNRLGLMSCRRANAETLTGPQNSRGQSASLPRSTTSAAPASPRDDLDTSQRRRVRRFRRMPIVIAFHTIPLTCIVIYHATRSS